MIKHGTLADRKSVRPDGQDAQTKRQNILNTALVEGEYKLLPRYVSKVHELP